MNDFFYDLGTIRDGLLTLETAFFELTDDIPEASSIPIEEALSTTKLPDLTSSVRR